VRLPIPPPPHKTIIRLSNPAAKKKYLFTSDSVGCQQKTAILQELPEPALAEPVLQALQERFAGPELPAPQVRFSVPEQLVWPEQTWMT
jgi:hypothetical protein